MLVELRDVEVYIEPDDILIKAMEEGDISTERIVGICISEDGADEVLSAVNDDDIQRYCEGNDIVKANTTLENIIDSLSTLDDTEKARLLWALLKPTDTVVSNV